MIRLHGNIRFSKTHSEYQKQPYPLEKTTIAFLDPPKKNACNIRRIFMENSGTILIFNIPGTLFGNIPLSFVGNVFRIFRVPSRVTERLKILEIRKLGNISKIVKLYRIIAQCSVFFPR